MGRMGAPTREKEAIAMATPNRQQSAYGKTNLIDDVTASTQGYSRRQVAEIVDATLKAITDKVPRAQQSCVSAKAGGNARLRSSA